jgi:SAM-dependent methyltransferase
MKDEYINHRCSYEGPGVRPLLAFLNTAEYQEMRKYPIAQLLSNVLEISKITSVLDYGGDTGKIIPDELSHANKYITDIESRVLNNGITLVTSPNDCEPVDLVICGHTLEHVSYPMELIADLKKYLKPGGWLYLEIPKERDGNYEPGHQFHEHINHFNFQCLEYILKQNGFDNLEATELDYEQQIGVAYVVTGKLA